LQDHRIDVSLGCQRPGDYLRKVDRINTAAIETRLFISACARSAAIYLDISPDSISTEDADADSLTCEFDETS